MYNIINFCGTAGYSSLKECLHALLFSVSTTHLRVGFVATTIQDVLDTAIVSMG
jgi:hypothetical protein